MKYQLNRKNLEKLIPKIREIVGSRRQHFMFKTPSGYVNYYEESSHSENDPQGTFFSIRFKDVEVSSHPRYSQNSGNLTIELKEMDNLDDFDPYQWMQALQKAIHEAHTELMKEKIVEVNGKKYRLVEEENEEEDPF